MLGMVVTPWSGTHTNTRIHTGRNGEIINKIRNHMPGTSASLDEKFHTGRYCDKQVQM